MSGKIKTKMWGGRFNKTSSNITEKLSQSIHFDQRLYKKDIEGSIAHAKMLQKIGILTEKELKSIIDGLLSIEKEIDKGTFEFSSELEDIHMNIEARLTDEIGEPGKKLHTGRSRNDQVSLDMRLYVKSEIVTIRELIIKLINELIVLSEKHIEVLIPGYTHLQVAQPVRLSHHFLAYAWKFLRDLKRLENAGEACDVMPLGSGALAGVNYQTDREFLRKELCFKEIMMNSIDAVSDRDFVLDFLYFSSVLGTHLSRFCEEIILWSTSEFSFIRLADEVTTGSSIMPQKRNPDLAELIRGKTGRLNGNLVSMLTTLKGLPMSYNRDLQEDKEPLFDSIDTIILSLEGMIEMLSTLTVKKDEMEKSVYSNFSTATDLADYLVKRGVPFRECHEIVGKIVKYCEEKEVDFFTLNKGILDEFSSSFGDDIVEILDPALSTERKLSAGSTAKKEIFKQIELLKSKL